MKIKLTLKNTVFENTRFFYNILKPIDTPVVCLTKVVFRGDAGDNAVFVIKRIIPELCKRNIITEKIFVKYINPKIYIDSHFYIPYKTFLTMKNKLC